MQSETAPKPCFFDDDDITIKFEFQKPEEKHRKDLQTPYILKNTFTMKTSSSSPTVSSKTCILALHNKFLAQYKVIYHFSIL